MHGKIVLITGASGGLGVAMTQRFWDAGATVYGADLEGSSRVENFIACDVSRPADLQRAVATILNQAGRLDVVVANAGWVAPWHSTAELNLEDWETTQAINVRGVAFTLAAAADALKASQGVALVMSSVNGRFAHSQQMAYTASKHAVLGIMRSAARDLGPFGVRVNALAPGPVSTPALLDRVKNRARQNGLPEQPAIDALNQHNALRRMVSPEEVAEAAYFLCSPAASGISGVVLPVDAGIESL